MDLLFYSILCDDAGEKLREKIEAELPEEKLEIFRSIGALAIRLQEPRVKPDVAVLHASNREELLDLISLAEFLQDIRIILILPDRDPWTVARGHKLRPRFISDRDNDYSEITIILKRLLRQSGERENSSGPKGRKSEKSRQIRYQNPADPGKEGLCGNRLGQAMGEIQERLGGIQMVRQRRRSKVGTQ